MYFDLDDKLACFRTTVSLYQTPQVWLDASQNSVLADIQTFQLLTHEDKSECAGFIRSSPIYQRLIAYTFTHIVLCDKGVSLLDQFRETIKIWKTWDRVTHLVNHRSTGKQLWVFLQKITKSLDVCQEGDRLKMLLDLDAMAISAQLMVIIHYTEDYRALALRKDKEAQSLLDLLQALLDYPGLDISLKTPFLRMLKKLSKKSGLYPECLILKGIETEGDRAVAAGRFGEVWKGCKEGRDIAIKVMRIYQSSAMPKLLKEFSREASIWLHLSHQNVLPFYGVYHWDDNVSNICFVSPWMDHGNVNQFLQKHPEADRASLVLDVAQGLEYLHMTEPSIVHGSLKGANILVTPSLRACLADFGLVTVVDSQIATSSFSRRGTLRWLAPELLKGGQSTLSSDIYSFACVCYEVFSGNIPLSHAAVTDVITTQQRPSHPSSEVCQRHGLDNGMWLLITQCWQEVPTHRPLVNDIVRLLRTRPNLQIDRRPLDKRDDLFTHRLRSALTPYPFSRGAEVCDKENQQSSSVEPSETLPPTPIPGLPGYYYPLSVPPCARSTANASTSRLTHIVKDWKKRPDFSSSADRGSAIENNETEEERSWEKEHVEQEVEGSAGSDIISPQSSLSSSEDSGSGDMFEPAIPLEQSADRCVPNEAGIAAYIDPDSLEMVDRKVKGLLNKLTMKKFDPISDQIIAWVNRSESAQILFRVICLVFESLIDEANLAETYARLCWKIMEQISCKIQDDTILNLEGKPIASGQLVRKYLLSRCQEDFERGWEALPAAPATDSKNQNELYRKDYAAQKSRHQGLGLIMFIGELFKLQMLTERIMHECVKKLLGDLNVPDEEDIESLCKLLSTIGANLDTNRVRAHLDVYFSRMKELTKTPNVRARLRFMLLDVIELREQRWVSRKLTAAPMHEYTEVGSRLGDVVLIWPET